MSNLPWLAAFRLGSLAISDCSGASVSLELVLILIFLEILCFGILRARGVVFLILSLVLLLLLLLIFCFVVFQCGVFFVWARPHLSNVTVRLPVIVGAIAAFWPPPEPQSGYWGNRFLLGPVCLGCEHLCSLEQPNC